MMKARKALIASVLGMGAVLAASVGNAKVTRKLDCSALSLKAARVDPESGRSWEYQFAGICQVLDHWVQDDTRGTRLVMEGFARVEASWNEAENEAIESIGFEGQLEGGVEARFRCNTNPFQTRQACIVTGVTEDNSSLALVAGHVQFHKSPVTAGMVDPKSAWQLAAQGRGSASTAPPPPPPPPAEPEKPAVTVLKPALGFKAPGPVTLEGEDLAGLVFGQGKGGAQDMRPFGGGWSNGGQLFWNPEGVGSLLNIPLRSLGTGQYEVVAYLTSAPDFAQLRAYVRYERTGGGLGDSRFVDFDGYAEQVGGPSAVAIRVPATTGNMTLVLVTMGKNDSSRGLFSGVDRIEIKRDP